MDLVLDFPTERVFRTAWTKSPGDRTNSEPANVPRSGAIPQTGQPRNALRRQLSSLIESFTVFPDLRATWMPFAREAGERLLADWRPDVIYASGPPFTSLLIAQDLSSRFGVDLVGEFRDRWSDDPYSPPPFWRKWRNRHAEAALIEQAVGLVTVSEPWATAYRERFDKRTAVVSNGFDAELCADGPFDGAVGKNELEIVYTGGIYPGYRDPSPLFAAMKKLDNQGQSCRMIFHGVQPSLVAPLAEAEGVSHLVEVREVLSHEEALRRQRESDILVLMQWNNPKEQGNVPGKFFEYLGARRPILVLGLREGVPATIVRERDAGYFSNDPTEIAEQLSRWLAIKQEHGHLPAVPESARAGYARDEQFARLEPFLVEVVSTGE
jgi:hypothetical protein